MFDTDRGKEFDNKLISDRLSTFNITRSLSNKEYSYNKSVADAMFKVFKTEFTKGVYLLTLELLNLELHDYVHLFNDI